MEAAPEVPWLSAATATRIHSPVFAEIGETLSVVVDVVEFKVRSNSTVKAIVY
jgi:hypothetical protein